MLSTLRNYLAFLLVCSSSLAQSQTWQAVTDEQALRDLMTNTVLSGQLTKGVRSRTTFNADGSGELEAWNGRLPRTLSVEGQQVCVVIDDNEQCCCWYWRLFSAPG